MELLRKLFSAFRRANFKISAEKSQFFQPSVDFVGHNFSVDGVRPKEEKLSALYNLPVPETKKQLRTALGGISYYRKFIGGYANQVRCLQELLKNDVTFKMEPHHIEAFLQVREKLKNIPTLAYPDESATGGQFFLTCDASMSAVSYVLTQIQTKSDGRQDEVLIACGGRALRDAETRWPPIHTEALAVLLGVVAYKHYFVGRKVTVRTDSLTVSFVKDLRKSKHNRLYRWGLFLDTVPNLHFVHVPGKLNVVADMLSRRPYNVPPPPSEEECELLDETMVCSVIPFRDIYDLLDEDDDFAPSVYVQSQGDLLLSDSGLSSEGGDHDRDCLVTSASPDCEPFSGDSDASSECCVQSDCCSECCSGYGCSRNPVDDFLYKRSPRAVEALKALCVDPIKKFEGEIFEEPAPDFVC